MVVHLQSATTQGDLQLMDNHQTTIINNLLIPQDHGRSLGVKKTYDTLNNKMFIKKKVENENFIETLKRF